MIKRLRFHTHDSPLGRIGGRPVRDDVLHAIPPGKVLVLGKVWTGSFAPMIDSAIAAVSSYCAPGLSPGRPNHAEPSSQSLDLGRRWLGDLQRALSAKDSAPDGDTDVTGVLKAVDDLRTVMGTSAPTSSSIADSLAKLKRARDAVRTRTSDQSSWQDRARDNAARAYAAIRTAASHLAATSPTNDSATEVRDQLATMTRATHARDQGTALNAANKAFWDGNSAPKTIATPATGSGAGDQINQRNAEFWKGQ